MKNNQNGLIGLLIGVLLLPLMLATSACGDRQAVFPAETILQIDAITVTSSGGDSPTLTITVEGTVSSSGWNSGELTAYEYVTPPTDGIYHYTAVAVPPNAVALSVLTPISITAIVPQPTDFAGVTIHGSLNAVSAGL